MAILRLRVSRSVFQSLPPNRRRLFLGLAHMMNEIALLAKTAHWARPRSYRRNVVAQGEVAAYFTYLRLLAGKLWEAWHSLVKRAFDADRSVSQWFMNNANEKGREALKELRKRLQPRGRIDRIRNEFAFHYDPAKLDEVVADMPDELEAFVEYHGTFNTLYYFAEAAANQALLTKYGSPNDHDAARNYHLELHDVAMLFFRFGQTFMALAARAHPGLFEGPPTEVRVGRLPRFAAVHIPWFTNPKRELKAAKAARKKG